VVVHRDREALLRRVLPDHVLVEERLISTGFGRRTLPSPSSPSFSSAMMSRQMSTHSSQM